LHNISIIAAIDSNGLIGKSNHLPWKIKEDLHFFRETTMGHIVVMGKRTWFSIGKPLDGRINIILTHDAEFSIPGCVVLNSVQQVLDYLQGNETFIIGGAHVFEQFILYADKIYLTRILHAFDGDTYFPELNWQEWIIKQYEQVTVESGYQLSLEKWERI
jgi:dihydrofolate reductase